MQDPKSFDMPIVGDKAIDELKARLAKVVSAYNGKYLHKLIVNLDAQQIREDIQWLEKCEMPIDECLYDVLAITTIFHDKNKRYFTVEEFTEIEKKGIRNYLKTKEKEDIDALNKLDDYINRLKKRLRPQASNFDLPPRSDLLIYLQEFTIIYNACAPYYLKTKEKEDIDALNKLDDYINRLKKRLRPQASNFDLPPRSDLLIYLQEFTILYNACAPYDEILCNYSDASRGIFRSCAQVMTTLLGQWLSESNWPRKNNSCETQLDYAGMKLIVARLRNDVVPEDQNRVDVLASNIDLCVSCDEIDRIMAQEDNSAVCQELDAQLQELFKCIANSLIEKSSNLEKFEKDDAYFFRKIILININKYTRYQYRENETGLILCLHRLLEDLFHTFFTQPRITLSNFKDYMDLAIVCNQSRVFLNCEVELMRFFHFYLASWLEIIKSLNGSIIESRGPNPHRVIQAISPSELLQHRSIILRFRFVLGDLGLKHRGFEAMLYPHFDELMQVIMVSLDNGDVFLALIKDAFDIKHPNAVEMLRKYYRDYTAHLVGRSSYDVACDLDGRVIGVKSEEIKNWNDLLERLDMQPPYWEAGHQKFDIASCYLEIIYRYFSHTHITAVNVEFAFKLLTELKNLRSSETKKILYYFYADFIAFTHHAAQPNFFILMKMLTRLSLEKDISNQEKQNLFCAYLKVLFSEVIMHEIVKEPQPSGLDAFVGSRLSQNDILSLTERAGNNFSAWLNLCNSIITCNKKVIGSDPQYVVNLREIVSLLTPCLVAENQPLPLPKKEVSASAPVKKVMEEEEPPKKPFIINILPSDHVDGPSTIEMPAQSAAPSHSVPSASSDAQRHNIDAQPALSTNDKPHAGAAKVSSVKGAMLGSLWSKSEATSYFVPPAQQTKNTDSKNSLEKNVAASAMVSSPAATPAATAHQPSQQSTIPTKNTAQSKPLPPFNIGSERVKSSELNKAMTKPISSELSAHFIKKNAAKKKASEKRISTDLSALSSIMMKAPAVAVDDLDEIDPAPQEVVAQGNTEKKDKPLEAPALK